MFTLQAEQLGAGLLQAGMPPEQVLMFQQVLGNCAQALEQRGPVTIDTSGQPTNAANPASGPAANVTPPALTVIGGNTTTGSPPAMTVTGGGLFDTITVTNPTDFIDQLLKSTKFQNGIFALILIWITKYLQKTTLLYDYRYDTASHNFQKKTQDVFVFNPSAVSAWLNVYTTIPETAITNWRYYTSTHNFEIKTQQCYVMEAGTISAFTTNPDGNQPVNTSYMTDVTYASHALTKTKTQTDTYVLEAGSTANTNVFTAAATDIVTDVSWSSPTLSETKRSSAYILEAPGTATTTVDTATAC